jgi:uncharacterized membrane protein YqgA involved in biofilm formation
MYTIQSRAGEQSVVSILVSAIMLLPEVVINAVHDMYKLIRSKSGKQTFVTLFIGAIILFFIGSILVGNLEPVMTDQQTSDASADMNDTIDDVVEFGWLGMQLAVIALLIMAAAYLIRNTGLLGT